ncbi:MAG TPA: thioredoxin family protein [Pirellulales bacterium]|nr:thioredoxin family protein [Pirellulales bacterium]
MIRIVAAAGLVAALVSSRVLAGEYNEQLSIGDRAPAWKNLPGVDGKQHSLADLDAELVLVVFTCNSCPVAADYEDRIIALAKKYGGPDGKLALAAINVNRVPEDSVPKMKERAEQKGFPFPYLFDASQQIAKDYGAAFTPEFFLLDKERRVLYMGGMDDNSNAAHVKTRFLEPAIEAALAGDELPVKETVAIGCRIRYVRERKPK